MSHRCFIHYPEIYYLNITDNLIKVQCPYCINQVDHRQSMVLYQPTFNFFINWTQQLINIYTQQLTLHKNKQTSLSTNSIFIINIQKYLHEHTYYRQRDHKNIVIQILQEQLENCENNIKYVEQVMYSPNWQYHLCQNQQFLRDMHSIYVNPPQICLLHVLVKIHQRLQCMVPFMEFRKQVMGYLGQYKSRIVKEYGVSALLVNISLIEQDNPNNNNNKYLRNNTKIIQSKYQIIVESFKEIHSSQFLEQHLPICTKQQQQNLKIINIQQQPIIFNNNDNSDNNNEDDKTKRKVVDSKYNQHNTPRRYSLINQIQSQWELYSPKNQGNLGNQGKCQDGIYGMLELLDERLQVISMAIVNNVNNVNNVDSQNKQMLPITHNINNINKKQPIQYLKALISTTDLILQFLHRQQQQLQNQNQQKTNKQQLEQLLQIQQNHINKLQHELSKKTRKLNRIQSIEDKFYNQTLNQYQQIQQKLQEKYAQFLLPLETSWSFQKEENSVLKLKGKIRELEGKLEQMQNQSNMGYVLKDSVNVRWVDSQSKSKDNKDNKYKEIGGSERCGEKERGNLGKNGDKNIRKGRQNDVQKDIQSRKIRDQVGCRVCGNAWINEKLLVEVIELQAQNRRKNKTNNLLIKLCNKLTEQLDKKICKQYYKQLQCLQRTL